MRWLGRVVVLEGRSRALADAPCPAAARDGPALKKNGRRSFSMRLVGLVVLEGRSRAPADARCPTAACDGTALTPNKNDRRSFLQGL